MPQLRINGGPKLSPSSSGSITIARSVTTTDAGLADQVIIAIVGAGHGPGRAATIGIFGVVVEALECSDRGNRSDEGEGGERGKKEEVEEPSHI